MPINYVGTNPIANMYHVRGIKGAAMKVINATLGGECVADDLNIAEKMTYSNKEITYGRDIGLFMKLSPEEQKEWIEIARKMKRGPGIFIDGYV